MVAIVLRLAKYPAQNIITAHGPLLARLQDFEKVPFPLSAYLLFCAKQNCKRHGKVCTVQCM